MPITGMDFSIIHELFTPPSWGSVQTCTGRSPGSRIRASAPPFPPALPERTTDGGYEVDYRLQWRDRPGFSPGSLFSLSGTWNMRNLLFRNPFYSIVSAFVKKNLTNRLDEQTGRSALPKQISLPSLISPDSSLLSLLPRILPAVCVCYNKKNLFQLNLPT